MWHSEGNRKELGRSLCGLPCAQPDAAETEAFLKLAVPGLPSLRGAKARQLFLIIMIKQDF